MELLNIFPAMSLQLEVFFCFFASSFHPLEPLPLRHRYPEQRRGEDPRRQRRRRLEGLL